MRSTTHKPSRTGKGKRAEGMDIESETVSISRLAKVTGLDRRTLDRICISVPTRGAGKLLLASALRAIVSHYRENTEATRRMGELHEAKARNELALSEIALKEASGELVPRLIGLALFRDILELGRQWAAKQPEPVRSSYNAHFRRIDPDAMAARAIEEISANERKSR